MMKLFVAAVLSITALSSAASAEQDAKPKKVKKAPDPNKQVCKSVMTTGSRMATSECHTAAEWEQIAKTNAISAQDAARIQQSASPR